MIDRDLVQDIVGQSIKDTDLFVVDISVKTGNIVSIILDSDSAINIDCCADVSRFVYSALENAGEDDFELNVYSAGLSEPLKLRRQYLKYINKEVDIVLNSGKKLKGTLLSIDEDEKALEVEYETMEVEQGRKRKKKIRKVEKIELASIKSTKPSVKI
ncbi:MAG: ribosome assembly cofactor RimP [Prevotellaceae bacterium]|jgi:ribosome maturation factor RimP|nr:ribosome assembly cofactor RimP [Prevotellaceae bacterium]